ncbi:ribokinase [Amycolatopsis magusensis]|uniref:ribokinase n=1 Tax=Amycolatopsis magusensis TaxID=882444 RepID=UPI0024A9670B|nr:ribokinase [Amycolatopsis magusensis]MDI5981297.1 ribokinase [Amycolatopsis magusensis]UJW34161.1 ribokinase [Saccharothrix sp. AJ9571]
MTAEVLVAGSINADLVVPADRRPGAGETVLGGDTELLPGGKGANTAVAASLLGAQVAMVGAIGDDANGRLLLGALREAGVRVDLVRTADRPTGAAYIVVTPDGENSILVSPGANSALEPSALDGAFDDARVLAVSMEIPLPTVEHAVIAASEAGVRVLLNLSPVAKVSERALAAVDVLLVNEHEAAWLLGDADADPRGLLELGPFSAVLTRGARGALVITEDGTTEVPSPEVEAVDTTGAGDAFTGALAASLAEGATLVDAARLAVKVAAISVTRSGAQPSYPRAGEID